jgi:hypothetical protein
MEEAVSDSETSVNFDQITRRNIREDSRLHTVPNSRIREDKMMIIIIIIIIIITITIILIDNSDSG